MHGRMHSKNFCLIFLHHNHVILISQELYFCSKKWCSKHFLVYSYKSHIINRVHTICTLIIYNIFIFITHVKIVLSHILIWHTTCILQKAETGQLLVISHSWIINQCYQSPWSNKSTRFYCNFVKLLASLNKCCWHWISVTSVTSWNTVMFWLKSI